MPVKTIFEPALARVMERRMERSFIFAPPKFLFMIIFRIWREEIHV